MFKIDPSIRRVVLGNFQYPLGVYPVEDLEPAPGYVSTFEQADSGTEGDLEEWPDRYTFDIVLSSHRLPTFCRSLFMMLPGRVYPILDVLGQDAFREIDPYMAYELVGLDQFLDGVREYGEFLYEDGMCGFGAMSEEPFIYVFIDEHKVVTLRIEPTLKDRVEKLLQAFDLEPNDEAAGADAAAHEHRTVLLVPPKRPELLAPEEIYERLRDQWRLLLNIDPGTNVDEDGKELGTTSWRCVVRCEPGDEDGEPDGASAGTQAVKPASKPGAKQTAKPGTNSPTPLEHFSSTLPDGSSRSGPMLFESRYAEIFLDADSYQQAEEVAISAIETITDGGPFDPDHTVPVVMDRLRPEQLRQSMKILGLSAGKPGTQAGRKKKSPKPKATKEGSKSASDAEPLPEHEAHEDQDRPPMPAAGHVYSVRWLT